MHMRLTSIVSRSLPVLVLSLGLFGCQKEEPAKKEAAPDFRLAPAVATPDVPKPISPDDVRAEIRLNNLDRARSLLTRASASASFGEFSEVEAELNQAEQVSRAAELSRLSDSLKAHVADRNWSKAEDACDAIRQLEELRKDSEDICRRVKAAVVTESKQIQEKERGDALNVAIQAAFSVAEDKRRCDMPNDVSAAWTALVSLRPKPTEKAWPLAKRATAALEKCRRQMDRTLTEGVRQLMITQREQWANLMETQMLNQGIDVRVSLKGKYKDQATLQWVLFSRPLVHQLINGDGFVAGLEKIGLRKITFSDGYYESFSLPLSPQDEGSAGRMVLRESGLDVPLKL